MADSPERPTNWAQARARIDRGETGDKIAVEDPATVPLGTDAEAGGVTTAAEDIARSDRLQAPGERSRTIAQARLTRGRARVVPWLAVIFTLAVAVVTAVVITG